MVTSLPGVECWKSCCWLHI